MQICNSNNLGGWGRTVAEEFGPACCGFRLACMSVAIVRPRSCLNKKTSNVSKLFK